MTNLRASAAVIAGSFADYRLVKSRSVLQVIVEIPIEMQGAAFAALGYPLPGTEIPVAVARLNPRGGPEPERIVSPASQATPAASDAGDAGGRTAGSIPATGAIQRQRYAAMSPEEQAVTRAALLCQDVRFRAWVPAQWGCADQFQVVDDDMAAEFIRERCCDGRSRKLIGEVPEYFDRFLALETSFRMDVGELARPR